MRFALIGVELLLLTGCSERQPVPTAPTPAPTSPSAPAPLTPAPPAADIVLSGLVHETAPTEERSVAGAAITAVSGERMATAVADERGRFTVKLPPGEIRITVSASRYEAVTHTLHADTDASVSIALPYTFRMIEETWHDCCLQSLSITVRMPVHHAGTLTYIAYACFQGCSAGELGLNCATVREVETGTVIDGGPGLYDNGVRRSVEVQGGHTYELTLFPKCFGSPPAPVPGVAITGNSIQMQRPI